MFDNVQHHVNYILKIFPIRYQNEKERMIFIIDKKCKEKRSEAEAYEDYAIMNNLPEDMQLLTLEQKEKFEKSYIKDGLDYTYTTKHIYKPSNASRDEHAIHSLCLIFTFSKEKKEFIYKRNNEV